MAQLKLSKEIILEKEFDIDIKGYNAKQVDVFLDEVFEDYETYNNEITKLEQSNKVLMMRNNELEEEVQKLLQSQVVSNEMSPTDQINALDILKRLSKLEQDVYNQYNR
jgi:DivIVA domain-containing protein